MAKIFKDWHELKKELSDIRKGREVVLTNGCFDIVHLGHLRYLQHSAEAGDYLVVALNSDDSVKKLKGDTRPINKLDERMEFISYIKGVDFVTCFSGDTPYDLIKFIRPDVLVKGGDWPIESIVGVDIVTADGGRVESLKFEEGYSTTSIIEKIVKIYC
ncbi:D-glycero-beta-D-manno-heptose 1-phosphate adenylyltransferase [Flexistipes sinusarabici]|uniref:D-glycero-beta-D-manno-heptose 1-phosphate adenylyltransferase n=1 Tax=Flexistipes sinusarabici TaxID=2352 RepID=A0A3D5QDI8_FLESI|nr:D-glycero-beta-D-manno-heptose 1-phosphate adenylyltransferase [Flexistipes sinusarabici]HCW93906.1 D-glycero-beta-D-manno-heptose 1-phosphate adenylyltransferase [Flexistipes sinusarabici]